MKFLKSDRSIHQNAPNCTNLKNFLGGHAPEPPSKAHGFAMRSMSLRDMQISKSEKKILPPPPAKSWGRPCINIYHIVLYKEITLEIKQYSPRRIKLHTFSKFSRRVACPLACVQLIPLFLYEKNHFFIQNAIKIYAKTHQL